MLADTFLIEKYFFSGQKFAILEIKNAISKLIRHFQLKPPSPKHEMIIIPETVLKSQNGVRIKLGKRLW